MKKNIINTVRRIFCYQPFRGILRCFTQGASPHSLVARIAPPNFLFSKNTILQFSNNGYKYSLDMSDYIGHYLYFGFADNSLHDLYAHVKDGDTVFDIGANVGHTAIHFATCAANTTVYAFEPDVQNFQTAATHLQLNNIHNVKLFNFGLGDKSMQSKLYVKDEHNRGMNRLLQNDNENLPYSVVHIKPLDEVVEELKIQKIDLIKIDVEGFEMKVLTGAKQTLQKFKPALFLETNNSLLANHQSSISEVAELLTQLNYRLSIIPDNKPLTAEDIVGSNHFDLFAEVIK